MIVGLHRFALEVQRLNSLRAIRLAEGILPGSLVKKRAGFPARARQSNLGSTHLTPRTPRRSSRSNSRASRLPRRGGHRLDDRFELDGLLEPARRGHPSRNPARKALTVAKASNRRPSACPATNAAVGAGQLPRSAEALDDLAASQAAPTGRRSAVLLTSRPGPRTLPTVRDDAVTVRRTRWIASTISVDAESGCTSSGVTSSSPPGTLSARSR